MNNSNGFANLALTWKQHTARCGSGSKHTSEKNLNELPNADCLPDELPANPMRWADAWLRQATADELQPHPNAMTLVTVAADGQPSARIVLCKDLIPDPGYLVFYTNYESRKAQDIAGDSRVAAQFHWDAIGLQVRIEGIAVRSPEAESDEYFASRDWGSQLGAWGSDQSAEIGSRDELLAQIRQRAANLGLSLAPDGQALESTDRPVIARPPHWGGYRIWATAIELWLAGADRIHERALWQRQIDRIDDHEFTTTAWESARLQP